MKEYQNRELLAQAYKTLGSLQKVADYYKVSKKLILNYMKKLEIQEIKE